MRLLSKVLSQLMEIPVSHYAVSTLVSALNDKAKWKNGDEHP